MKHMITPAQLASQLKENINWLWENKCGCCHWHLLTDDKGREWSIVLGWNNGGYEDSDNENYYIDEGCAIATKIAYQEQNCIMQTDMDIDFSMPFDEKTGEVDDTRSEVSRNADFLKLADELLKTFKRVVSDWATFDEESQMYLGEIE